MVFTHNNRRYEAQSNGSRSPQITESRFYFFSYLDYYLGIDHEKLATRLYDKRDDFNVSLS